MMDSIMPWVGGKNSCANKIVEMMPEHYCYVEVFAGGCVHPSTRIDMYNGLLKKASDVRVGDLVLTHKGNYKKVSKVFERDYNGNVYIVKTIHNFRTLVITPEHPVLTMKRNVCGANLMRVNEYHKGCPYINRKCNLSDSRVLNYNKLKNINKGDYLVYPIHKMYDNVIESKGVDKRDKGQYSLNDFGDKGYIEKNEIVSENKVEIDDFTDRRFLEDDFLELCGFYLAEGSLFSKKAVEFSFNTGEKDYINSVIRSMKKYFECTGDIRIDGNSCKIRFFSVDAYRFFKTHFGDGARNKVISRVVMELPVMKLTNLVRSYIYGDGTFGNNQNGSPIISIKSVSFNLLNQIKIIFNRLGVISSISYKSADEVNKENAKYRGEKYVIKNIIKSNYGIYLMSIQGGGQCIKLNELLKLEFEFNINNEGSTHGEINSDYVYVPIHSIEKAEYEGKVYNFEVEDDSSYVADGFCVHNCWIYFAKPVSKVEVINDLNGELVNFYRVLQRKHEEFVKRAEYELYARELYYEYERDWKSGEHFKMGDVERAFRFFVLIRMAYSAKFGGGWSYGATRNKPKSFFDLFRDDFIDKVSERLKNTYIDNRDFEDVIKGYDGENTVVLADPPYVLANVDDYYFRSMGVDFKVGQNQGFSLYDQQRLYKALSGMKGKFILTIDDCAWIRERYCDGQEELGSDRKFWWVDNEIYYTSSDMENRRTAKELIICNYNIQEQIEKNKKFNKGNIGESLADY